MSLQMVWLVSKPSHHEKLQRRLCNQELLGSDVWFSRLLQEQSVTLNSSHGAGQIVALVEVVEGCRAVGSTDFLLELGREELFLSAFFLNSRLNYARVIRCAVLKRPRHAVPVNALALSNQTRLYRMSPIFIQSLAEDTDVFVVDGKETSLQTLLQRWGQWGGWDPHHQFSFVVPDFVAALVRRKVWTNLAWHPNFVAEKHFQLLPGIPCSRNPCPATGESEPLPVNTVGLDAARSLFEPSSFLQTASLLRTQPRSTKCSIGSLHQQRQAFRCRHQSHLGDVWATDANQYFTEHGST